MAVRARLDHALDVVVAGHVGTDCFRSAVFLTSDLGSLVRGVLVDIGA